MICTADEESGGERGIRWMIENHYDEIDAEYVLDEGGMGSRDALAANELVFGVSVGDKVIAWLRLRAKGTAGHGSQPIPDNANLILLEAIRKAMVLARRRQTEPRGRRNAPGHRASGRKQIQFCNPAQHCFAYVANGWRRIAAQAQRDTVHQ